MTGIDWARRTREKTRKKNGFSLIISVFVILLFSLLMLFSATIFSTDIEIALDSLRSTQALFLCEGAKNYCIKHELINDSDWSNNTDTVDKPFGNGTISIFYDPNLTLPKKTTVRIVAKVDDITRKTSQSFRFGWPRKYEDFPYILYTTDNLTVKTSPGFSIENPYEVNNTNAQTINCKFLYYKGIADVTKSGWYLEESTNRTFTGIIYVNGNVDFDECSNFTINGTIIATGYIKIGCDGLIVNPSLNYPALVAGSYIEITRYGHRSRNVDIRGTIHSGAYVKFHEVKTLSVTGIIYAGQHVSFTKSDDVRIDGSIIAHSEIKFDSCGGTGPDVNWGNKVLKRPPGFSWKRTFMMDRWQEVLK